MGRWSALASERRTRALALGALLAGLTAWLWPIGLGGRMPVGGDATRFALGLMAEYRRTLQSGRLPLWNDLWGYGFPGVAESQMGVYYPPHLLLYGLLPLEGAYTASFVLHTFWGGTGAFWAARRLGASATGSALAGFSWAASGFFLIHLPHHWAAPTASWMPWAVGLSWPLACGAGRGRDVLQLAAVLALQALLGHFQLAFETQVSVALLAVWGIWEGLLSGPSATFLCRVRTADHPGDPMGCGADPTRKVPDAVFGWLGLPLALGLAAPLAALQVVPTARLARLAAADRDYAYLSGFTATPIHLISYVAPGLFHRSPLWRPVAWDPFHTSPEEQLGYIGLVPLFLALGGLQRSWRQDPAARALGWLALGSLVLSLGPNALGFRVLIMLPGFSLFRAPARWGVVTELALALLAAKGLDRLRGGGWPRAGRSLVRFVGVSVGLIAVPVLGFELALASTAGRGWPAVSAGLDRALRALPWSGDPPLAAVMAKARRPAIDGPVRADLLRRGEDPARARLDRDRAAIYALELGPTGLVLLGLVLAAHWSRRPRAFATALIGLTAADLLGLAHQDRPVALAPIRPLERQSAVLARLGAEPRGTRAINDLGNLIMAAGVATLPSYRTLDRPALGGLIAMALGMPEERTRSAVLTAVQATGAGVRLFDPFEGVAALRALKAGPGTVERIRDPVLAGWLYGDAVVARRGADLPPFVLWRPVAQPSRAWLVPDEGSRRDLTVSDVARALDLMRRAVPLSWQATAPERVEVEVQADGSGWVVIAALDDPQWRARWTGGDGPSRPAEVLPILREPGRSGAGWQGVRVPGPGRFRLHLEYDARAERLGLAISVVAWAAWSVAYWGCGRDRTRRATGGNPA